MIHIDIGATKAVQDRLKTTKIEESKGASLVFCWDTHCYAVKMELPECITDYDSFFEDLGFPKEAVSNGDVRIIKSNSRYITISYGDKSKEIEKGRLEKYKVTVQTKCVVLKIKALWNSSENNLYGIDKKRAIKCIPDIENYEYVPVNNSMLAKAEIPFLLFERNRGKCFIEMY